jgi:3-isopropylmalate dehydrogenase
MILAAKMMLEWLGEQYTDQKCLTAAQAIEDAVTQTLRKGLAVPDLGGNTSTIEMGKAVADEIFAL